MENVNSKQTNNVEYVGIYVHIPFCNSKCSYCNFNSYVVSKDKQNTVQNNYINALVLEIQSYKQTLQNSVIDTIFIGGGTPSILVNGGIKTIISTIKQTFQVLPTAEISMEINPNAFSPQLAQEWLEAGVNRVSVGLQTANNQLLNAIGRTHTVQEFITTMQTLKQVGFKNINADIMLGLPNQTLKDVKNTLKLVTKFKINHISAYDLILEDNTPLTKLVKAGKVALPTEKQTIQMYNLVYTYLKRKKYIRYEVSNYAKNGYECKHNLHTWRMQYYVGFGAGAHSFYNNTRHSNKRGIETYINAITKNNNATDQTEKINNQELLEETILLGMRTRYGINLADIKTKFNIDLLVTKQQQIKQLLKLKLIKLKNNIISLTPVGYLLLNKIVLELVY